MAKPTHFWSRVEKSGDCWEWQGAKSGPMGYGKAWHDGRLWQAHRLAYLFTFGDFDRSLFVCHRCDNPPCVNPNHLWLGTHAENDADREAKGRTAKGRSYSSTKLTEEAVAFIRENYVPGTLAKLGTGKSAREIGQKLQIHPMHVTRVARGGRWAWLQNQPL